MSSRKLVTALSAALAMCAGTNAARGQHQHEEGEHEHAEKAGHAHDMASANGGVVTMSKEFHIETVFLPDQIRLYLYDGAQNPMHVKHWKSGLVEATGEVQFRRVPKGRSAKPIELKFSHATPGGYACSMCPGQRSDKPGKCGKCGMKLAKQAIPEGTLWSCPMHPDEKGTAPGKCKDCGMKLTPQDYLVAMADLKGLKSGDAKATITLKNLSGKTEKTLRFTEKFVPAKKKKDDHGDHDEGGEHEHGKPGEHRHDG